MRFRAQALAVIETLATSDGVEIVPVSADLFAAALDLYRRRPDKDWGLTDYSSFVVMSEFGLQSALTADEHFRQAGFRALLLEDPPSTPR